MKSHFIVQPFARCEIITVHRYINFCHRYNSVAPKSCCDGDRTYNVTSTSDYNLSMSITPPRERCPRSWAAGYYEATGTYQTAYRNVLRLCLRGYGGSLALFDCTNGTTPEGWWNQVPKYDPYQHEPNCESMGNSTAMPEQGVTNPD